MKSSELTGITYNGLSIEEHLARRPEPETEKMVKEEIAEKKKAIYYGCKGWIDEDGRKVSRRVSYLSANKIREEYGIMQKQYKTLTENIIYVVRNMGPVTANEIQQELKKTYNLSATVRGIWQGLAGIMGRDLPPAGRNKSFIYFINQQNIDKSVETIYGLYRTGKYKREKVEPYKVDSCSCIAPQNPVWNCPIHGEKKKDLADAGIAGSFAGSNLKKTLEEALSKQLGLEVKVSGEIRVVFGWAK